jgi:hypothetical protein
MGDILTGFMFFIPKYGLRSKENFCLYSTNLMWMPGQNMLFIVIFTVFFYMRGIFPKLYDLAKSHRKRRD